ncbi:nourseothricin acetyltransferase [Thermoplasma volcanium GSS1]|uniref:Nourseothricin acetyltransferase n=1 Tax=Thermoplasma volcanium (strain ATCC 51530 / DSM 4299 / JCM 9571 / NBRC 15438 / GSS1) TaxID=273116 RepID=Q97AN0_THEVO|nr:GNAT family N-acetyltransferase [Thermoplasma volcanium]BAB59922.1 nourseothricin acetyltransferase [Thermoplasma volcanium GSS1]
MDNANLRWDLILRPYIDFVSRYYPDPSNEKRFNILIEKLTNNEIKNRVLIHGDEVMGYAFMINSMYGDRSIGNIGFMKKDYCNDIRLKNLLEWIHVNSGGLRVFLDEIFNANDECDDILAKLGYSKVTRIKLTAKTNDLANRSVKTIKVESFNKKKIKEFVEAEYEAFKDTVDLTLLPSNESGRITYIEEEINGTESTIVPEASFIYGSEKIQGGLITVKYLGTGEYFISDLFVSKEQRNKGIATALLNEAAKALRNLKIEDVSLIVSEGNPAIDLYKKMGFEYSGQRKYVIYIETLSENK